MASQVVNGSEELQVLEINSYIRGYHAYQDVWTPVLNESLLVKREPNNIIDSNAVAVYQDDLIVGHVPYNLAPSFSFFLQREVNKAFAEVLGEKVNRGAGYGLEIPCKYRLYGPKGYIIKMREIVDSLVSCGFV